MKRRLCCITIALLLFQNYAFATDELIDSVPIDPPSDPVADIEPEVMPPDVSEPPTEEPIPLPDAEEPLSLINEFIPNPIGNDTENEWIELYNSTSDVYDLSGWYLDDAEGDSRPYKIPDGTYLLPNDYLVFSELDLKLTLKNSDDVVRLLAPDKAVKKEVYYVGAEEGFSYSKKSDDTFEWTPILTPASENQFPAPLQAYEAGIIVFDSALPDPGDLGGELINLWNRSDNPIDLINWRLQDASGNDSVFGLIQIGAGEVLTLTPTSFSFGLNNTDEVLSLYDPLGNLIDQMEWKASTSGHFVYNLNLIENGASFLVTRVIDGDTFEINWDGRLIEVRMIGIDAPESVHPFIKPQFFGPEASQFLSDLLTGKEVRLEFEADRSDHYGRLLAYVNLEDQFINQDLVRSGYARAYTDYPFKYESTFLSAQAIARQARIGLWREYDVIIIKEYVSSHPNLSLSDIIPSKEEKIVATSPEVPYESLPFSSGFSDDFSDPPEAVPAPIDTACFSDFLKIDSFLPNAEKDVSTEYIRLINTDTDVVCLNGWILDDSVGTGSKSYLISGGSIAPSGFRSFRKDETGLALNNEDDCVTLINPLGQVMDKICYGKTHPNEIFTHAGGDYQTPIKVQTTTSSANLSSSPRYRFSRDPVSYDFNFIKKEMAGKIASIDAGRKIFYLELEDHSSVPVSYAHSKIDVSMAKTLMSLDGQVKVDLMGESDSSELISIQPLLDKGEISPKSNRSIYPYLFSFTLLLFLLSEVRRFIMK